MMEFKNTIEALHFNAEEIRQLVANLEKTDQIGRIDIDLILEKIRSLYDLVLDIQTAINEKKISAVQPEQITKIDGFQPGDESVKPEKYHEERPSVKTKKSTDMVFDDDTVLLKEKIFFKDSPDDNPVYAKSDEEKLIERKQTAKENLEKDLKKEKTKIEETDSKKPFVSDRFKTTKPTLHEELANKTNKEDIISQSKSHGSVGITSSLGLNEKFEIINELFGGSKEKFEYTMQLVSKAGSFVEAYNYLKENFRWDMDSQYAQRLLELIRRKLIVHRDDQ